MPYRRFPKTDQARLKSLKKLVQKCETQTFDSPIVSFGGLFEAKNLLNLFEGHLLQYRETFENQVTASKKHQKIVNDARMYVSHFIQVLNLSVIRGEIKREKKELYKLDPKNNSLPELKSEAELLYWGKNIINGENARIQTGGVQIYNPTITKVMVFYEIFKEHHFTQKNYQGTTIRNRSEIIELRKKIDVLILNLWNQVEEKFKDEPVAVRIKKCEEYGLIYYYRKGEKREEDRD